MYKKFKTKTIHTDRDSQRFYHYSISMKLLCKGILERIKINKDSTVLVTGTTGSGKSTLIGKLCFQHFENMENIKIPGEKMYTDENFMVDPEDFASRMIIDKGNVLWVDEGRDGLSSKNWNSQINKTIISRKNKNRKRGIVSFILLPYEKELDKSFLNHVTMWIWIRKRKIAEVYVANNSRKGGQALNVQRIIDREEKWFKENPGRRVIVPTIHPEYVGDIGFGIFTKAEQKRYDHLVDIHHASGKLTDEEEEKINIVDKKELEKQIPLILDQVEDGAIKSKREMWNKLKELTNYEEKKLITHINRHLDIRGFKKWSSFKI